MSPLQVLGVQGTAALTWWTLVDALRGPSCSALGCCYRSRRVATWSSLQKRVSPSHAVCRGASLGVPHSAPAITHCLPCWPAACLARISHCRRNQDAADRQSHAPGHCQTSHRNQRFFFFLRQKLWQQSIVKGSCRKSKHTGHLAYSQSCSTGGPKSRPTRLHLPR